MKQFSLDNFLQKNDKGTQNAKPSQPSKKRKSINDEENYLNEDTIKSEKEIKTDKQNTESIPPNIISSKKGVQSLLFNTLVTVLSKVEVSKGENSRDAVKELFANLFIDIISNYPDDFTRAYYFLNFKVGPEYRSPELGIGPGSLEKCVSKVIGITDKQIKEKMIGIGDLSLIASEGKKTVQTMDNFTNFIKTGPKKSLSLAQVLTTYKEIANMKGKSSFDVKTKSLCKIMFEANKDELKFIIRSLQKSLKIGASSKTIIFSLGRAVFKIYKGSIDEKEASKIILQSICQLSDEDIVFKHLLSLIHNKESFSNLATLCKITPGIPISPQLARPTTGIQIIFNRFDKIAFTCEYKYDGFRGQIHHYNNKTEIFSRNLQNMTETYPDIVEYVDSWRKSSNCTSFILDCEMVAFDKEKNKILPFQQLTTRSRKNVDIKDITIHVCMFVFDILYLNDNVLTEKTLKERREILINTFQENTYIQFAKSLTSENPEEIRAFMNDSITSGCEGLIIKALTDQSQYQPGQRNFSWLKLKKDYLDTSIGDSIDLVVIGAEHGKGKRVGFYGSFLLACYNDDTETFESVTMTGAGLKDTDLEELHKELMEHLLEKPHPNYRIGQAKPDVFFEPYMVWEIKTADLTLSPIYSAGSEFTPEKRGISMRFPRFIRVRPDKKAEEAVTSSELHQLYVNQASITEKIEGDDLEDLY